MDWLIYTVLVSKSKVTDLKEREERIVTESEELDSDYERSEALMELEEQVEEVCAVWQVQGEWEGFQVSQCS